MEMSKSDWKRVFAHFFKDVKAINYQKLIEPNGKTILIGTFHTKKLVKSVEKLTCKKIKKHLAKNAHAVK